MKKYVIALAFLISAGSFTFLGCTQKTTTPPCNGIGTLNIENKLDSSILVKVTQTHTTKTIDKDFTLPFSLAGDQPYAFTIDGPQYHKDTTIMILNCDNQLFIVTK
jgi:hypothetical protein